MFMYCAFQIKLPSCPREVLGHLFIPNPLKVIGIESAISHLVREADTRSAAVYIYMCVCVCVCVFVCVYACVCVCVYLVSYLLFYFSFILILFFIFFLNREFKIRKLIKNIVLENLHNNIE